MGAIRIYADGTPNHLHVDAEVDFDTGTLIRDKNGELRRLIESHKTRHMLIYGKQSVLYLSPLKDERVMADLLLLHGYIVHGELGRSIPRAQLVSFDAVI